MELGLDMVMVPVLLQSISMVKNLNFPFRLVFSCINVVGYEALPLGFKMANQMNMTNYVYGSELFSRKGERIARKVCAAKNAQSDPRYRSVAWDSIELFDAFAIHQERDQKADHLVVYAFQFQRSENAPMCCSEIELLYRPSIPDNIPYWQASV